ncbi:MAG: hypothetical protein B7X55_04905, partial [Rhodobacterales bacterium 34-62-10]
MSLLEVKDLNVSFRQDGKLTHAVRGVSFTLDRGQTVALVGESGSGKSVTALSTVSLLGDSAQVTGSVTYDGQQMIGADAEAIDKAEDRQKFRDAMDKIGLESARSGVAHNVDQAFEILERTGLPSIIRPSFTLGGTGGGIAYNKAEFERIVKEGLDASPTTEVLIEESLLGWKEYEMEVVRDRKDNCIIICSIENVDPMGV